MCRADYGHFAFDSREGNHELDRSDPSLSASSSRLPPREGSALRRRRSADRARVAAVGILTASLSIAATEADWLTGEPAPPPVVARLPGLHHHSSASTRRPTRRSLLPRTARSSSMRRRIAREGSASSSTSPGSEQTPATAGRARAGNRLRCPISAGGLGGSQDVLVVGGRVADERATADRLHDARWGARLSGRWAPAGSTSRRFPGPGNCPSERLETPFRRSRCRRADGRPIAHSCFFRPYPRCSGAGLSACGGVGHPPRYRPGSARRDRSRL